MWMKIDDGLHAHRKTRAVTKSHNDKRRDASAMGLWVLAGSWAAQNGTDGWVPEDELDRWDDDWKMLAARLVEAGYWWPQDRDGEPGFGFNDWLDYNPESEAASRSGTYGNHVRWHLNKGIVAPECEHCPSEPEDPESPPDSPPESGTDRPPISPPESHSESRSIALPGPTRPDPIPVGPRKRGTQLPEDFKPSDEHVALARELGVDLRTEWPKFVDHARANGKIQKDWSATLRNWIRNAQTFSRGRVVPLPAPRDASGYAPDDLRNPNRRPMQ